MNGLRAPRPTPPASQRRGGAALGLALALLAVGAPARAAPPAPPCGPPGVIGLGSRIDWRDGGAVEVGVTLTAAPVGQVAVWPLLFVDGHLRDEARPLALPCGVEVVVGTPPLAARHAVHWTLLPWPPVAPGFAALHPDDVARRAEPRDPPGLFPWSDVATLRPPGARPAPRAAPAPTPTPDAARADPAGPLDDDRVLLVGSDGAPFAGRWARAPLGRPLPFRVRYAVGALGAGPALATCLLDERQIPAFDGEVVRAVDLVAGEVWTVDGVATLDRAGWQRLHCLLLPDDPGERPDTWPRPLLGLYLWGDP
jgi:hypothetical protein